MGRRVWFWVVPWREPKDVFFVGMMGVFIYLAGLVNIQKSQWILMGFHGISWDFNGILMGFHGILMGFHGDLPCY